MHHVEACYLNSSRRFEPICLLLIQLINNLGVRIVFVIVAENIIHNEISHNEQYEYEAGEEIDSFIDFLDFFVFGHKPYRCSPSSILSKGLPTLPERWVHQASCCVRSLCLEGDSTRLNKRFDCLVSRINIRRSIENLLCFGFLVLFDIKLG